jgi:hypothetical protein
MRSWSLAHVSQVCPTRTSTIGIRITHPSGGDQAGELNGEPAESEDSSQADATEKGRVSMKTLMVGTNDDDQAASLHVEAVEEGRQIKARNLYSVLPVLLDPF